MRPMAAAVASEEPERAAKPEQAKMDEIARPPGNRARNTFAASNNPAVRPVWNATKPIKRNMGTALIVQLATKL